MHFDRNIYMRHNLILIIILFLFCPFSRLQAKYEIISKKEMEDKVSGAWAGKMIGVMYGREMEFKALGKIYDGDIPWMPQLVEKSLVEDDIYGQLSFMITLERYGLNAPVKQLAINFANAAFPLCHANLQARKNIFDGVMPPLSGSPQYSMHSDDIDFQIESDFIGFMNPGMPQSSNLMCDSIGRIMAYGDGLYGGMFVVAMHTMAYFDNDVMTIVKSALKVIPSESTYAQCIQDVVNGYIANPNDWEKTWTLIQNKWGYDDVCIPFHDFDIDAKLNGAFVAIGLLYGNGDFEKTMQITIRCGQDTDCNTANVAAVLGIIHGYSGIPDCLKSYIPEIADKPFLHTDYSYHKAVSQTLFFIKENIVTNGGKIGKDFYKVKVQEPTFRGKLERSYPNAYMNKQIQVKDISKDAFKGDWSDFVYGDGDPDLYKVANAPGDSFELKFNGTGISLLGSWNVDGGRADVYVDGKFIKQIDVYYREEAGKYDVNRAHIFHLLGLSRGEHVLRLVVSKENNPVSSGHKIWLQRAIVFANNKNQMN